MAENSDYIKPQASQGGLLGPFLGLLAALGRLLGALGCLLGAFWVPLGALLGCSWAILGPSGGAGRFLIDFWSDLGANLAPKRRPKSNQNGAPNRPKSKTNFDIEKGGL